MSEILNGSCQCGKRKFQVKTDHNYAYYCHCRMCQKAFGNIFATLTMVKKVNVVWLDNEPQYYHSSKLAKRGFCPNCGTPMTFEYIDSEKIDLAVGCFDNPDFFELKSHSGYESKVHWIKDDELPKYITENNTSYIKKWKDAYGQDSMPGQLTDKK